MAGPVILVSISGDHTFSYVRARVHAVHHLTCFSTRRLYAKLYRHPPCLKTLLFYFLVAKSTFALALQRISRPRLNL